MNISNYIDYTLLSPSATERDIINLCSKALDQNYNAVCINSAYVPLAKQLVNKTPVKICAAIGFPLGAMSTASKVYEAKKAVEDGAHEIEMVINLGFLKSRNYVSVLRDISNVKLTIGEIPLKVIIEISELNKNEVIKVCEICLDANADYIKTSTGFSKTGATLTDVKIIKKTIKNNIEIVAYDGIDNFETALKYFDAGVSRIGTSSTIKIPQKIQSLVKEY